MSDEYCFAEHCRYRHWQSGSMPTHRKGDGCPKEYTPSTDEVRDVFASDEFGELKDRWAEEFDRWHAAEIRRAKAEALRDAAVAVGSASTSACKTPGCHRADQIILEARADQIERGST